MKPTRGLSSSWRSNLTRERRVALVALAALMVLLGTMVLYQRYLTSRIEPDLIPEDTVPGAAATTPQGAQTVGAQTAPEDAAPAYTGPPVPPPPPKLVQPLTGSRTVAQPFGWGYSAAFADYRQHEGVDYAAASGESVLAAGPGRIASIVEDPAHGMLVEIDHGSGLVTRYSGLSKVLVSENASVQAQNIIGQLGGPVAGEKGLGPHLHFEVSLDGENVDPVSYLKQ